MRAGDRHLMACFPYLLSEASFGVEGAAPDSTTSRGRHYCGALVSLFDPNHIAQTTT